MWDALFWIYLVTLIFMTNHEIDSAYQKEWELIGLPGGINLFLLLHFPLLFVFLWGLVLVYQERSAGLVLSLILSLFGMASLVIHSLFIKKGHRGFTSPMSQFILWSTALVSAVGAVVAISIMLK
jgi:hypothetical protein